MNAKLSNGTLRFPLRPLKLLGNLPGVPTLSGIMRDKQSVEHVGVAALDKGVRPLFNYATGPVFFDVRRLGYPRELIQ